MNLPTLRHNNFGGKKVLVRCDFNVPMEKGKIVDDFRIERSLPTIKLLKRQGAKVILMSHLSSEDSTASSLLPVANHLEGLIGERVVFSKDCVGREVKEQVEKLREGEIILLENLRKHREEKENNENFATELAQLGEVYVNEAFSVSHRSHASIVSLPKFLPAFVGINFEEEIKNLSKLLISPPSPFVIVMGGAKLSKIKSLEGFLKKCDHILLGGKIANIILRAKESDQGLEDNEVFREIKKLDLNNPKLHFPSDVLVSPSGTKEYIRSTTPYEIKEGEETFDIGEETIRSFLSIIKEAKALFWAGPMGFYENEKFAQGTQKIAEGIANNTNAFRVIGGGDTISAVRKFGLEDSFSYISCGGGATLEFLSGKKLPGIEALKNQPV